MQDFKDRLFSLKEAQDQLAQEYQTLLDKYDSEEIVQENVHLRRESEKLAQRTEGLEARLRQLEAENSRLLQANLGQDSTSKRASDPLTASKEKMDTYMSEGASGFENRLGALETKIKQRIDQLYEQAERQLGQDEKVIVTKLGQFQNEIHHRLADHRRYAAEGERKIQEQVQRAYDGMTKQGVEAPDMSAHGVHRPNMSQPNMTPPNKIPTGMTSPSGAYSMPGPDADAEAKRKSKQDWLEMKIGLNWINKLGILLIILAVGAAFQWSYLTWFTGNMKGASFFLLGLLMMAGGEWTFRKNKQVFALGLLGGGISILYGSVFYSYFLLEIISLFVGLVLSILITVAAVLLSLRYESRTICSFGLVGGYLPFFSYMAAYGLEGGAVYTAMGYLFLFNALILLVSLRKRWPVVNYISFVFNIFSMLVLVFLADIEAVGMVYTIVTFVAYLSITLYVPFKYKSKLTWWDFSLLALNTVINCATLYSLFEKAGWDHFRGLLALVFCLSFLYLARLSRRHLEQEKETQLLFYGTSLTFSLLVVPFQFGIHYLSMAWMLEGLILSVLGQRYSYKNLERVGWGITGLCVGAFLLIDCFIGLFTNDFIGFSWKYTIISLGIAGLALFYGFRLQADGDGRRYNLENRSFLFVLKHVAMVNIWLYVLYETNRLYEHFMPVNADLYDFYRTLLFSAVTLLIAYAINKVSVLHDQVLSIYLRILSGIGYLMSITVTLSIPALSPHGTYNSAENYMALVILIGYNLMVFFSGRDLIVQLLEGKSKLHETYPVILGMYIFGIITAFLGVQFRLGHIGWLFSLVYLLLAIGYIAYGFRHHYLLIRRIGLGLSLLATGKMLLFDLNLMTTGSKIAAYFSFGVILLAISYLYQRVSTKISAEQEQEKEKTTVS